MFCAVCWNSWKFRKIRETVHTAECEIAVCKIHIRMYIHIFIHFGREYTYSDCITPVSVFIYKLGKIICSDIPKQRAALYRFLKQILKKAIYSEKTLDKSNLTHYHMNRCSYDNA